jgi:tetratricopeptide repeat protein
MTMTGALPLAALLLAVEPATTDEDNSVRIVRLPGGETARVEKGRLQLRRGNAKASLALPESVSGIQGVSKGEPFTITLEQTCPPALPLSLSKGEIEARFLLAEAELLGRRKQRAEATERLRKASALAPKQTDVRLALARLQLEGGNEGAAIESLRAGLSERPLETYWGALVDSKLSVLAARLGLPPQPAGVVKGDVLWGLAAWAPERRWFASVEAGTGEGAARLVVWDVDERELLSVSLEAEIETSSGEVTARSRPRARRQAANLDKLLGAFGFRPYDPAREGKSESADHLSWLRWKDRGLSASAGNQTVRVRRDGKVVFERKIETMGTIALGKGHYLPEAGLLLLGWSRVSGSDDCPNGSGLVIVKLPQP